MVKLVFIFKVIVRSHWMPDKWNETFDELESDMTYESWDEKNVK